jgi:tRNA pseudouridine55 synthase
LSKQTYRKKWLSSGGLEEKKPEPAERIQLNEEQKKPFLEGRVLLIDKPLNWTSFDVIRKLRGVLQIKKIGHAGTLDPLATGLLIVCTGKFTREINTYMAAEKEYTGTFTLGAETPTYDLESEPSNFRSYSHIKENMLSESAERFTGFLLQRPPVYSAIKKNGTAAYELARRGEAVELEPRPVTIRAFDITLVELPLVHFRVICSTGTYIRSLAHDFGAELGCGAYLSSLRRTRIGAFPVADAHTLDSFIEGLRGAC